MLAFLAPSSKSLAIQGESEFLQVFSAPGITLDDTFRDLTQTQIDHMQRFLAPEYRKIIFFWTQMKAKLQAM